MWILVWGIWGVLRVRRVIIWVVWRIIILVVGRVLVGQQQVYLSFNPIKMCLDLLNPMVQLVKTPSNLFLERSLQRIVHSEDQFIRQRIQGSSIYTSSSSTCTRTSV